MYSASPAVCCNLLIISYNRYFMYEFSQKKNLRCFFARQREFFLQRICVLGGGFSRWLWKNPLEKIHRGVCVFEKKNSLLETLSSFITVKSPRTSSVSGIPSDKFLLCFITKTYLREISSHMKSWRRVPTPAKKLVFTTGMHVWDVCNNLVGMYSIVTLYVHSDKHRADMNWIYQGLILASNLCTSKILRLHGDFFKKI